MNRERFIRKRRADWQAMESLLKSMKNARLSRWSGKNITRLSTLYRSVCYDLSLVQSREWGSRLEQYLNDLVAQGHNCLYRSPPRSVDAALEFLSEGFPKLVRKRKVFVFLSLALFLIPFLASMIVTTIDPALAERLVDREAIETAEKSYSKELYQNIDTQYAEERSFMAAYYVQHNIGIAFQCFALGVFFGIGTVATLLFNGISIGAVTGYLISKGHSEIFFSFAISHGSFELTAIVISGAAGLLLGWGMIHPGQLSRTESIRAHGMDAIKLASGAAFMLAIAALIEGYFSPMAIPPAVKYCVGTMLWVLVIVYLGWGGRGVRVMFGLRRRSSRQSAGKREVASAS